MTDLTRRQTLAGILIVPLVPALSKIASATTTLEWAGWRGDERDFFRAPVLVTAMTRRS